MNRSFVSRAVKSSAAASMALLQRPELLPRTPRPNAESFYQRGDVQVHPRVVPCRDTNPLLRLARRVGGHSQGGLARERWVWPPLLCHKCSARKLMTGPERGRIAVELRAKCQAGAPPQALAEETGRCYGGVRRLLASTGTHRTVWSMRDPEQGMDRNREPRSGEAEARRAAGERRLPGPLKDVVASTVSSQCDSTQAVGRDRTSRLNGQKRDRLRRCPCSAPQNRKREGRSTPSGVCDVRAGRTQSRRCLRQPHVHAGAVRSCPRSRRPGRSRCAACACQLPAGGSVRPASAKQ